MQLLSDAQFDIRDYFGTLIIMYPESAAEAVEPLRARLDLSGHVYQCYAIGPSLAYRGDFMAELLAALDRCACFVPVITGALLDKKNQPYFAMLWHAIGYIKAKTADSIVPFVPKGEKVSLAGTPLQGLDILNDADVFFKTIGGKYASRLICNNYYENGTTNLYASRRIGYHCLNLCFRIYEEAFQNAKRYYKEYTSHRLSDGELDDMIREEIRCGCRVISFGAERDLPPQLQAYADEVIPRVSDHTRSLSGRKVYRKTTEEERERTGIRATLYIDLVVPVHKILGAYVKCYLTSLDGELPLGMLLSLLEPDFRADHEISPYDVDDFEDAAFWRERYPVGTHIDEGRARFYFELSDFERTEEAATPDPSQGIGDRMDFIFPQ